MAEHTASADKGLLSGAENLTVDGTVVTVTFRVAHDLMVSCILGGSWFCEVPGEAQFTAMTFPPSKMSFSPSA